jgi:2-iminobutanoate/2-iminopropanoate deaminase
MTTKHLPKDAKQHLTAGPYSPVLEVDAARIVVISGQVAIDAQGNVMGNDIEEQTRYTLANCQRQLKSAGCGFSDVFKVNVYLSDITEWARFNAVYSEAMPHPRPVRTTVGAVLLPGFRVEIEMWAAKPA